ncbi:MAG: hypothetical protein ACOX0U_02490 [Oscillospiraceae bacterium]
MLEQLKVLCALNGVSSFEDEVRDYLIEASDALCRPDSGGSHGKSDCHQKRSAPLREER